METKQIFLYRSSGCNAIHLLAASVKVTFLDRSVGVLRWKTLSFALRLIALSPGWLQNLRRPSHRLQPSCLLMNFYSCSGFLQRSYRLQSHICVSFARISPSNCERTHFHSFKSWLVSSGPNIIFAASICIEQPLKLCILVRLFVPAVPSMLWLRADGGQGPDVGGVRTVCDR